MSRFTFVSGNTRVLLRLPLYGLAVIATRLVPRTDRIWVFGSGIGVGEGALPLYRSARAELPGHVRLVWLASSERELAAARAAGLDAVPKAGLRGLWLTMRAAVLVVTHGQGDVNRYGVRGGLLVQLWHGIPLKRLHLDSPAVLRSRVPGSRGLLALGYRMAGRRIGLFPVASQRVVDRIASAFAVPRDRIVVTGDPRDDVLLRGWPSERRDTARDLLRQAVGDLPQSAQVVLYAPTWREGEPDPAAPDESEWAAIAEWLDHTDCVLVVRIHPLGVDSYAGGPRRSARVRLLDAASMADVTPVLPAVDVLITDYSSIAFDYALVGGPIVFLAADVADYDRSRGLYEPYRTVSGSRQVASWPHVLVELDELRTDPAALAVAREHTRRLRDEHFDYLDGHATERVLVAIRQRLSGGSASAGTRAAAVVAQPVPRPVVTGLRFDDHELVVDVSNWDETDGPPGVRLDGARASIDAGVTLASRVMQAAPALQARSGLLITRWGRSGLALPSGDYRLSIGSAEQTTRVSVQTEPRPVLHHPLFVASTHAEAGGLVLRVRAPLAPGERRPARHGNYRETYLRGRTKPESAVFFESFYGRSASCNPAGIDRALARMQPGVTRYWSVVDGSVAVPDGAVRLVEGTSEWWRVRAEARVYVVNDWLRWTFRRRPYQHVLQTWHGTMLKRLALDRPGVSARTRLAVVREQRRWDALLAQNPYSARIFRSAYAVRGPIWELGYPRNDGFADPSRASAIRAAIGVPPQARIVLYAPTWRDDRNELVDHVDLHGFAADLPEDHVLLVRGHSRTLGYGADLRAERLVDVTSYPDTADLLQVADVLVTDYSSVMFDFAATGKQTVFFTPDIEHYADVLRGFYFDLLAEAPGPVATTRAELLDAVAAGPDLVDKYASQRAVWRQRFTPWDDGRAGERVVQRMLDEGWLG